MPDTLTPNLGLTKPEINPTFDNFGAKLNGNFDLIDTASATIRGVPVSATAPSVGEALVFNGSEWEPTPGGGGGTITGSGTAGQVTFWTGGTAIGGDSNLVWDNLNKRLGLGITPGFLFHILHGTFHTAWDSTTGHVVVGFSSVPTFPQPENINMGGSVRVVSGMGSARLAIESSNGNRSRIRTRSSQGPSTARTASLAGDIVGHVGAMGHTGTGFPSEDRAFIQMIASENWSPSANGMAMSFWTTDNGTTTPFERVRIEPSGSIVVDGGGLVWDNPNQRLGVGLNDPETAIHSLGQIKATSEGSSAIVRSELFGPGPGVGAIFSTRVARGTRSAPSAVQSGDGLGTFGARGHDGVAFASTNSAGMGASASENWTPSARGTSLNWFVTPNGSTATVGQMFLGQSGNLRVGTGSDPGFRIHANGDINATGVFRVNGTQIASGNLTDGANLFLTDGSRPLTGDLVAAGFKVIGLGGPSASDDAATKGYVDGVAQGLSLKRSVRVATTGNISLSGAQTIDGVSISTSQERVLVKDQTDPVENGIYVSDAGAWPRAADADNQPGGGEVTSGMFTFVSEGTVNAGRGYVLATPDPIVLGTTALTFTQFSDAGGGVTGSGTVGSLSKWTSGTVLGDSIVSESGSTATIGGRLFVNNGTGTGTTLEVFLSDSNPSSLIAKFRYDNDAVLIYGDHADFAGSVNAVTSVNVTSGGGILGQFVGSSSPILGRHFLNVVATDGSAVVLSLSSGLTFPDDAKAFFQYDPVSDTISISGNEAALILSRATGNIGVYTDPDTNRFKVDGDVNVTGVYKVNGAQIASSNLSNDSALIKTTTTLGGDLSGNLPNPTVAKLGTTGTSVTVNTAAPPTTGQVLTATSATTANWQTPSGGGGGYATVVVAAPSGVAATDTTNIQSAINAVNSAGGGVVILREGVYLISTAINPKSGVTVQGQGKSTGYNTGLSATSTGGAFFGTTLRGTTGLGTTRMISDAGTVPHVCTFKDLNLDFGVVTRGGSGAAQDMVMKGGNHTFINVTFIGTTAAGNPTIDITPSNTLDVGKHKFIGCDFYDAGTAATRAFQISGMISDCYFEGTAATFDALVGIVGGAVISNCYFASNKNYNSSLLLIQNASSSSSLQSVTVSGCTFKQYTTGQSRAIRVDNITGGSATIIGNTGDSSHASVGDIQVLASASPRNVVGNTNFAAYSGGTQTGNV